MVYGHFTETAVTEESNCNPLGIYGALKYGGEKLVIAYNQVFDLPYTIVRPSALYGERCVSRRVGQIFIENALTGKDINIAGDGSDQLDFTYIKDLVKAIELVISKDESLNQTFNLTYGDSRSLADMAEIMKANFKNLEVNYTPKDNLTPDRGTLSIEKSPFPIGIQPGISIGKGYLTTSIGTKSFILKSAVDSKNLIQKTLLESILNRPAYKINEFSDSAALKFLQDKNYNSKGSFFYTKVDCSNVSNLRAFENSGFALLKKT